MAGPKIVLTDEPEKSEEITKETPDPGKQEEPEGLDDPIGMRFGVTEEGFVAIQFTKKIKSLTISPAQAIEFSKAIYQTAKKAAEIRSRIVVPVMAMPQVKPS